MKFFENLNPKYVTDNKTFWKNVKPFFSNKSSNKAKINLVENEELITKGIDVEEKLREYF